MATIKTKDIKTDLVTVTHDFGEKPQEYVKSKAYPTYESLKYKEAKKKVIEMLDSGSYKGLKDSHFWILMHLNESSAKVSYDGLIISHDGMKIINDNLPAEKQVKAGCFSMPIMSEYEKDCMYMYYQDEETIEFGEISVKNCKNAYPYAMLFKRTYDRVVKDKAKMYGIYSEEEADEFSRKIDEPEQPKEVKPQPKAQPAAKQVAPKAEAKPAAAPVEQTLAQAQKVNNEGIDIYAETEKMYTFEQRKKIMEHYGKDFWYEMDFELVQKYYQDGLRRRSGK